MASLSEYAFILKPSASESAKILRYNQADNPLFRRIFLSDSVAGFYPIMELIVNDTVGDTSEIAFFVENYSVDALLGSQQLGSIAHSFFWSESQLNDVTRAQAIQGNWFWYFQSDFKKQDSVKSRAFKGTIDSIVTQVTDPTKDYRYVNKKANGFAEGLDLRKIHPTNNNDIFYQDNVSDTVFLKKLATYAFSSKHASSPFLCFYNLKEEFFFQPLGAFFQGKPVARYTLDAPPDNEKYITGYNIRFAGSDFNRQNYNVNFYSIGSDGKNASRNVTLASKAIKPSSAGSMANTKPRVPIRKKDLTKQRRMDSFGIIESADNDHFSGWINSSFVDSQTSYRMNINVPFNSELASGRTVQITVESNFATDTQFATEYSGEWLIIQSNHLFNPFLKDKGPNIPQTSLELIKPSIHLWNGSQFVEDFISA